MVWPFLASNETLKTSGALLRCGEKADRVDVAVAYLSSPEPLRTWLANGLPIKLVIALQPPTEASVIRSLTNAYPKGLEPKFYSAGFHSKLLIFYRDGKPFCAHVGSSNLTNGGLNSNLETNVLLREPQQLKELVEHFHRIWIRSADLEPTDLDHYKQHCEDIAREAAKIRKKQQDFEGRFVRPRISRVTTSRILKEARDYLQFWKTVDEVLKAIAPVLKKQFPGIPPYLAVDHFWHWLLKVWDQKGIKQLRVSPKKRDARLPQLFAEYATWYKSEPGYSRVALTRHSEYLRKNLTRDRIAALTKVEAGEVYKHLHAGRSLAKRFEGDRKFRSSNSLPDIRRAFNHLLWSEGDVQERISTLLPRGRFHLNEFGASCVQELLGFVHSDELPIRNDKADAALELLGFDFR